MKIKKKNEHAVALAKLGAQKGAAARNASMTPEQRSAAARHAVQVRWRKRGM